MEEYYFIVKIGAILIILITLVALIALFGWMRSCEQLRLERASNNLLKVKNSRLQENVESIQTKNYFLLNRISEVNKDDSKN